MNGKKSHCNERKERMIMGDINCRKSRKCFDVSEDNRRQVSSLFWTNMDWNQKNIYVINLVVICEAEKKKIVQREKM